MRTVPPGSWQRRLLLGVALIAGCTGTPTADAPAGGARPVAEPSAGTTTNSPAGAGQAAATPSLRAWTARSADGRVTLRQQGTDSGCRLEATVSGSPAWQVESCAATGYDLVFVAPDGERWLVLFPQPFRQGPDWATAVVAVFYRRGEIQRRLAAGALVAPEKITRMDGELSWLRAGDAAGGPGARLAEGGGGVLLRIVDGATLTLDFDGQGVPARPEAPVQPPGQAPPASASGPPADSIWAWEDAEGGLHYERWSAIPVNARRLARPVNGQISTVHAEAPSRTSKEAGLLPSWRPPAPDATAGPRLNGLTDAERARQDRATADAAERRRKAEEARFAEIQARDREASWNRSVGVGTFRVNTRDQECTRVGDIVQCRDAKSK